MSERLVTLAPLGSDRKAAKQMRLHFGAAVLTGSVYRQGGTLHVPDDVFAGWPLLPGQKLRIWQAPGGRDLHLGPLLGIIFEPPEDDVVARIRADVMAELGKAALQANVPVICFSIHDVDLDRRLVSGMTYRGEWQPCSAPLPDVVYNRGTYPDKEHRRTASELRRRWQRDLDGIFLSKVAGYNKWRTYQTLAFFRQTRSYSPATIRLENKDAFVAFVHKHREVFVKAAEGTWGQQVLRVRASSGGNGAPGSEATDGGAAYHVDGYFRDTAVTAAFGNADDLFRYLTERCGVGDWVVQQGIDLLKVHGRRFDVRIVLQKDLAGNWQVAQRLINWAGEGQIVTNNRQKAEFVPADDFASQWDVAGLRLANLLRKAERVCRETAAVLETQYGLTGEIGFDVGFDQKGRPWLFEANAKPFLAPGVGIRYPFEYARFLANRHWQGKYSYST